MNTMIADLIESLERLCTTIDSASIPQEGFQIHGWNQIHLSQVQLSNYIDNKIEKLRTYQFDELPPSFEESIYNHITQIDKLDSNAHSHFNNNAQHLLYVVPNIILTLNVIFDDLEYNLFSFEQLDDKKLLPKSLKARLRSYKNHIDSIAESKSELANKIDTINEAHEAAESLPTDLASLNEAKNILENLISTSKEELKSAKAEIVNLRDEAASLKEQIKSSLETIEVYEEKAADSSEMATKLVSECDDALRVATTQGLAAGFDQKAKELRDSIKVWVLGLSIALIAGAALGYFRVDSFTEALSNNLTAGQAILHTVMSVFSIGGPLWLAWISTQQINQRFKLSEDYSYKATVAKSFTGFKQLAERFDSETEQRLFNSTLDRLDEMPLRLIEGKDYNSPWHEFVDSEAFRSAAKSMPELVREAGRFASKAKLKKKPKPTPISSESPNAVQEKAKPHLAEVEPSE